MASKKAGRTKDKCKRYFDSGVRIKNAKRKLLKRLAHVKPETAERVIATTKIGRKREKADKK